MIQNRGQIRTNVRLLVGDSAVNSSNLDPSLTSFFSEAAYNRFIEDAYQSVVRQVPFIEDELLIDTVASQATYSAPDFYTILHIDWDDKPLEFKTAAEMYWLDEKWEVRSPGEPQYVIMNHTNEWGIVEPSDTEKRQFMLYPAPSASVTDDIRVIGKKIPQPLINDFNAPALPTWMHEAVQFEAAARVLEAHGEQRNENLGTAYRVLRDWYVGQGLFRMNSRHNQAIEVVGRSSRLPGTLKRETHIPYTGIAPGDPE